MNAAAQNFIVASPFAFSGGLDQTSTALAIPATRCIAALNYEPTVQGYQRLQGFERTDGRLPSETPYYTLAFIDGQAQLSAGDVITGSTSGASGKVLVGPVVASGSWGDGTATGTLVLVDVSGTFQAAEALLVAGHPAAISDSPSLENGAGTPAQEAEWTAATWDWMRHRITKPPGSGPVRGVFDFNGTLYAIRDDELATKGRMFKATDAGWVEQQLGRLLRFTVGLIGGEALVEGNQVTGATSGAKATVRRIVVKTGMWGATSSDADKAAGNLIVANQTGQFKAGEALKLGGTAIATVDKGDSSAITLPPGGRYAFKIKNFYGASNLKRIYGVNGVGNGFEYDGGNVLVPIETGMPDGKDKPDRIFEIANALGFTFPGGSIQFSDPGEPCIFNAILGAGEIGMGDDITDVIDSNDSAVVFFAKNKVCTLSGRGIDTFTFDELTEEAGAEAWTAQRVGRTIYLDRRGMRDLNATAAYGNFRAGSISELFDTYLQDKRKSGARPACSLRCRGKSQYRLFYDDGSGFTLFMGGKTPSMLPFELPIVPYTCWLGEAADGSEAMYLGAEDGYVYKLDSGTSFDGAGVTGFVMMPFNHLGRIDQNKRGISVSVEMDAAPQTSIGILAQYDYADGEKPYSGQHKFTVAGGGGIWDVSNWDTFFWSSPFQGMAEADIAGDGRNISIVFAANGSVTEPPHTLEAYTIRWVPRGRVKRTAR